MITEITCITSIQAKPGDTLVVFNNFCLGLKPALALASPPSIPKISVPSIHAVEIAAQRPKPESPVQPLTTPHQIKSILSLFGPMSTYQINRKLGFGKAHKRERWYVGEQIRQMIADGELKVAKQRQAKHIYGLQ